MAFASIDLGRATVSTGAMKAVFDTKPNSGYDDEIVRRYHFPTQNSYVCLPSRRGKQFMAA